MSCTARLHSRPVVKNPYSNCVLGTELFCTKIAPRGGRRVCRKANRARRVRLGASPLRWARCERVITEAGGGAGGGAGGVRARPGARTRRVPSPCGPRPSAAPARRGPPGARASQPGDRPPRAPVAPGSRGVMGGARGGRDGLAPGRAAGGFASWRAGVGGRRERRGGGAAGEGAAHDLGGATPGREP
jgi:hypothetical protein